MLELLVHSEPRTALVKEEFFWLPIEVLAFFLFPYSLADTKPQLDKHADARQ